MARPMRKVLAVAALAPFVLLAACSSSSTSTPSSSSTSSAVKNGVVSLSETGSTLMFPLFASWQTDYNKTVTNVNLTTAGTGSGTGIADAAAGIVDMGASDAYLSPAEKSQNANLLNIPLAVSSAMISYNVPGVKNLKLNGTVIANIYSGKITTWNDPAIKALNPGVSLPAMKIVTLHRSDSSGTTFIFVSYLNAQDPSGWPGSQVGTTVSWPNAPGALAENGNGGMVQGCGATKGCIAYIGTSYLTQTQAAHLGEAMLANKAGKYTQPTSAAVDAAVSQFSSSTPSSGTQSLINTSNAAGYPIVNYEYVIVNKKQTNAKVASAMKAFLNWTLSTGSGSKYLGPVNFEPLPSSVKTQSVAQISSISS